MHLLNTAVDQRLQAVSLALNNKFPLSAQASCRQKDVFDESQDAVLLNHLGGSNGLFDLLGDDIRGVQEVDFAVCSHCVSIAPHSSHLQCEFAYPRHLSSSWRP
jgi:hypothetical protein